MSKDLSTRCYKKKKGKLQSKSCGTYQSFYEKEKEVKRHNFDVNDIKIFLNMENKG